MTATRAPRSRQRAIASIEREVVACRRCPRLVAWREDAARHPPRRFAGQEYWAKPVPAFGDPEARIVLVGLAPAAHGGNRTGRMFTGDESGRFLFAALHAAGLANQPESTATGRRARACGSAPHAPPAAARRRTTARRREELANCREYLARELAVLDAAASPRGARGAGVRGLPRRSGERGRRPSRSRSRASRTARATGSARTGSSATYHPSQQNTFTGKLTQAMLRKVLRKAVALARVDPAPTS